MFTRRRKIVRRRILLSSGEFEYTNTITFVLYVYKKVHTFVRPRILLSSAEL